MSCSSATILRPAASRPPTARRSTCATSARRSSCSARRATTSRRRSRRSAGFSISTTMSTRSARTGRPSSTPSTRPSAISASSSRRASPQGTQRVLQQHRPDRCAAAGPLRGGLRGEARRRGESRPRIRRLGDALRGADARRHPRAGRQRRRGRAPLCHRGAGLRDQSRALSHLRAAVRARRWSIRRWRSGCASMHPLRLQYEMFSDANPFMAPVAGRGRQVRERAQAGRADNPFLAMQETMSRADRQRRSTPGGT